MNKPLLLGLIAAALVPAYPAASWLLGRQIETALDEQYRQLKEQPYVKLVRREYQRGILSSTEVATFQLFAPFPNQPGQSLRDADMPEVFGADPAEHMPLRFTVRSQIRHGPLPGLTAVAAATSDSTLELEGEAAAHLAKALGEAAPLSAHTIFHFDGSGSATLASPPFAARFTSEDEGEGDLLVSSAGFNADVGFSTGVNGYSFQARLPKLEVQEEQGTRLVMTDLRFDGKQQRVFDDEPLLMAGTQVVTLGGLSVDGGSAEDEGLVVKDLTYRVDVPVTGDFIDVQARLGAGTVQIGAHHYGPVHYDVSLRHMHARSTARLYRALTQLYADPARLATAADAVSPLAEPALALLNHGAEVSLDRLSFTSPQGEARLTARARLTEAATGDADNPFMLLSRLEASGEIGAPEALLVSLPQAMTQVAPEDETDEISAAELAARSEQLHRQIASLAAQGYVGVEGGLVSTRFEFRNGLLAVNGKPVKAIGGNAMPMNPGMHPMQ